MTPSATSDERGTTAELMAAVGDRYLLLIRENYLDDPRGAEVRRFITHSLRRLAGDGRAARAIDLAASDDWREAVVGLHYALVPSLPTIDLRARAADRLGGDVCDPTRFLPPLSARPAFLLLVAERRRDAVLAFLASDRPVDDLADVYAAAFVAEELTRVNPADVPAVREQVLTRLRAESWFDENDFLTSQERFCRAWRFWTAADLLDAVAGFQQDGYTMTPAEARVLGDAAPRNRPAVPVKSLPPRP